MIAKATHCGLDWPLERDCVQPSPIPIHTKSPNPGPLFLGLGIYSSRLSFILDSGTWPRWEYYYSRPPLHFSSELCPCIHLFSSNQKRLCARTSRFVPQIYGVMLLTFEAYTGWRLPAVEQP